jgi:phospho-N-acetylmuramoyl-pentapeptide-transferase
LAAGNPFLVLAVAPILLANGGGGLCKLLILRILRIFGYDTRPPARNQLDPNPGANFASDAEAERQILPVRLAHSLRFPFHDHCRKNWGWSNTQVLVRFMLLQSMATPLLFLILVKLR